MRHLQLLSFAALLATISPAACALAQDDAAAPDVEAGDPAADPAEPLADPAEPPAEPEPAQSDSGGGAGSSPIVVQVHTGDQRGSDDDDDDEAEEEEPAGRNPFDPTELQGDELYHFGVFARGIFVPQFIQNLFVSGGSNALRYGAGIMFNYRRDGFNMIVEVWGADFAHAAPYHGLNEADTETEWLEVELDLLFVNFAAMWSIEIASWLAIEVGFGLGAGGVFGNLWRTEAYPDRDAPSGWTPCAHDTVPTDATPHGGTDAAGTRYCDESEARDPAFEGSYQRLENTAEPQNFTGGVPPVFFWVDIPRIAIRIKPIRQIQLRLEGGFALFGFHFGGSLAIGF